MNTHVRLSVVALDTAINDPNDRTILAMSTLIATDEWLLEAPWNGHHVGDVQVYRNKNVVNGKRLVDEVEVDGTIISSPKPDAWYWWQAVPSGRIKSYRLADSAHLVPQTLTPLSDAERKEEPRKARTGGQATA